MSNNTVTVRKTDYKTTRYEVESEEFPIKGTSYDSKRHAHADLKQKEEIVRENIEQGDETSTLTFGHVESDLYDSGEFLRITYGLNVGKSHDGVSAITRLQDEHIFWEYDMDNGFLVRADIVRDNYCIRSLFCSFVDDTLPTGNKSVMSYKTKIFRSLTRFWD